MKKAGKNISALIFDMDGTIVDTIEDMADAVNEALRRYSLPLHPVENYLKFIGDGSALLIKRALGEENLSRFQEVFDFYYQYYQTHFCIKTKAYPGLKETLTEAKERGIKLFVYTNKPCEIAKIVAEQTYGESFFDRVVGIPLGGKVKPDPEVFLKATEDEDIDFSEAMYFGDSVTDLYTAQNLGIEERYSVLWGYQNYKRLSACPVKPKKYLKNTEEFREVIFR